MSSAEDILAAAFGAPRAQHETAAPTPTATATPPRQGGLLPEHVKRTLAVQGLYDTSTGAHTTARVTRCSVCRWPIFLGLDECGLTRRLDTKPLSTWGEVQALALGVTTYHLRMKGMDTSKLEIHTREATVIASVPATDNDVDVVTEHQCTNGYDVDTFDHQKSIVDRRAFQPLPLDPPF